MTWFDIVALCLLVLIAWLESVRGFGRALFDLLGAIIALKLAPVVAGPLAASLQLSAEKGMNQGVWLGISALALGLLIVLATRLIYQNTLLSLDYLDPIVGGLFGLFVGLIAVFFFLRSMQLAYGLSEQGKMLLNSFAGQEVLELRSYHVVLTALYNLGK